METFVLRQEKQLGISVVILEACNKLLILVDMNYQQNNKYLVTVSMNLTSTLKDNRSWVKDTRDLISSGIKLKNYCLHNIIVYFCTQIAVTGR